MDYRAIPKPGRIKIKKNTNNDVRLKTTTRKKVRAVKPVVQKKSATPIKTQKRRVVNRVVNTKDRITRQQKHSPKKKKKVVKPRTHKLNPPRRRNPIKTRSVSRRNHSRSRSRVEFKTEINSLRNRGRGRILVILGNGPSLSEAPIEKLKNVSLVDIMCINKPDTRVWPTTYWAFSDQSQYRRHTSLFKSFQNTIINSTAVKARKGKGQIVIRGLNGNGFSRDLTRGFHIGRSTVYANMQTALWMKYDRVFIFGIDMCKVGDKLHFYGENPDVKPDVRESRFQKEADNYERAYRILKEDEKIFTMCSSYNPWPFAEKFGKMDHKEAVPYILELAAEMKRNQKIIK